MAFPLLLFLVFATVQAEPDAAADRATAGSYRRACSRSAADRRVHVLLPDAAVRAQLLTLRNAEFVDAAHMVGASDCADHAAPPAPAPRPDAARLGAIAVATNILLEVGLSFIGVGVQPSTPTWGSLLSTAWGTIYTPHDVQRSNYTPWQTMIPTRRDPAHGHLAQPGVRRHPPRDRAVVAAMRRILAFTLRRLAAAVFTLLTLIAITFVVYWALPRRPARFLYPYAST